MREQSIKTGFHLIGGVLALVCIVSAAVLFDRDGPRGAEFAAVICPVACNRHYQIELYAVLASCSVIAFARLGNMVIAASENVDNLKRLNESKSILLRKLN